MSSSPPLSIGGHQLLTSQKSQSAPHILIAQVFKVDTVLAIGGQDGAKDVTIESPMISLFTKNFNNRFLPLGLNITLKHLETSDVKKVERIS